MNRARIELLPGSNRLTGQTERRRETGRRSSHEPEDETRRIPWSAAGGNACDPDAEKTGEAVRNREVGTGLRAWQPSTEGMWRRSDSSGRSKDPWSGRMRLPPRAGDRRARGVKPEVSKRADGGTTDRSRHCEVPSTANPKRGGSAPLTRCGPATGARASKWNQRSGGSSTEPTSRGVGPVAD